MDGRTGEKRWPGGQRQPGHDLGRVAVDLAVMPADGGEAISDLAVLRDQEQLFGQWQGPDRAMDTGAIGVPARSGAHLPVHHRVGLETHACV
jgi:hypothetical protein